MGPKKWAKAPKFGAFAHSFGPTTPPFFYFVALGPSPTFLFYQTNKTISVSTSFYDAFFTYGTKGLNAESTVHVWTNVNIYCLRCTFMAGKFNIVLMDVMVGPIKI